MTGDDVRHGRKSIFIRDDEHIHASDHFEQLPRQVIGATQRRGRKADALVFRRLLLHQRDQLRDVLGRHRRIDDDEIRNRRELRNRRQLPGRIEIWTLVENGRSGNDPVVTKQQRIPVRSRPDYCLGADDSSATRLVLHDNRLRPDFRQFLGNLPGQQIGSSARTDRHDKLDRLVRKLRRSWCGHRQHPEHDPDG